MNAIKLFFFISLLSLFIFSCGENKRNQELNMDAVINSQSNDMSAAGGNKCLLDYASQYDHLLTEDMALNASGYPKEKLKTSYRKTMNNTADHSIAYSFDMGRKQKVTGSGYEMVLPDEIILKDIKALSLKQFEDQYRVLTAEDERNIEEAKKEVLSGHNADAEGVVKKTSVDKKTLEKGMDNLTDAFKKISKGYVSIAELGDAARWNSITREMTVLKNGVQFALIVNVSNDDDRNQAVAIDLAKKILSKCH